jgi:indole-3-glycerol phosphate synthase
MPDFLDVLAADAKATVSSGYYSSPKKATIFPASLRDEIAKCSKAPVIAEVKAASPSAGYIREDFEPECLAKAMAKAGAVGISVLTEPKHFHGSLNNLGRVRQAVDLPILMKDIVVSPLQLATASRMGANVVLLIHALFDRGYVQETLSRMIADAHARKLEVLLETHNTDEFFRAISTSADFIGINNRNLGTLKVDLKVTQSILKKNQPNDTKGKPVVSESGISSAEDVRFLRECGSRAFLVGSAIMLADNVEAKVSELVNAYG